MNRPCGENSMLADTLFIFNIGTFEANLSRHKKRAAHWGGRPAKEEKSKNLQMTLLLYGSMSRN